jgi:hypothetical protein
MGVVAALALALVPTASAATRSAGGLKYVTKKVSVNGSGSVTATASCPKGTRTIGGGERNGAAPGELRISQTFPYDNGDKGSRPDDGWRVRVFHPSSSKLKIRVGAVCGDAKLKYREDEFDIVAAGQTGQVSAHCPTDTFALSGGVEASKGSQIYINSSLPSDPSQTGATAWGAYVDNPGAATKATVHVVCGKRKPKIAQTTIPDIGAQTSASLTCPAGRLPYGGGQDNNGGYLAVRTNSLGPLGTSAWLVTIDKFAAYPVNVGTYAVCGRPLN